MNKKAKLIEFIGVPTSDLESFCWEVDKENFEKITGKKVKKSNDYAYRLLLYPEHVFGFEKLGKCKIRIQFEEI